MASLGTETQKNVTNPSKNGYEGPSAEEKNDELVGDVTRPKNKKQKTKPHHVLYQHTLRKPSWTYFHLQLFAASSDESADILTAKRYLTSALHRFLGLHGAAIPVDILKLQEREVWIRVPREDATAVHEALASWTGDSTRWIVKRRDEWLVRLAAAGNGQDLFRP
jgi:ribonuclease P/MRP protein subunit POP8